MTQHSNIIRHPDLSRLTDLQLSKELDYTINQIMRAPVRIWDQCRLLEHIARHPEIGAKPTALVPFWKLHEDYMLHTERLQHIVDEIEYRRIP